MAHADKKHFGQGVQGKGDGAGAEADMTEIPANSVLSNRGRHGSPDAAHENAKEPPEVTKPPADSDERHHSKVSGGGGEKDRHHTHDPDRK
ncbi:hypothetical protein ACN9JG_13110 [Cereibacter azotoformans]|uniref:hypothetical protein n=1 Tax=Cereibacter azotoformans TaxID=43057 RepID=UPI003B2198E9